MTRLRLLLLSMAVVGGLSAHAQAPKTIYAYAVGNWRNGPVVTISPLFETTEAVTTPALIARVRSDYPAFSAITDIDVQRFATTAEGEQSRAELKAKYGMRKLEVHMVEPVPAEP